MLNYLHAREKGEQVKLKIANVTMKEKDLNDEVSNKTIDEIKILDDDLVEDGLVEDCWLEDGLV